MTKSPKQTTKNKSPFPSREAIVAFIKNSPTPVTKRDLARAFKIQDDDRIGLKRLLRELKTEGQLDAHKGKRFAEPEGLPETAGVTITKTIDPGHYLAALIEVQGKSPVISLRVSRHQERTLRLENLGKGDRLLVKLEKQKNGDYVARPIKRLAKAPARVVALVQAAGKSFRLLPTNRKERDEFVLAPTQTISFAHNDVVVAEVKTSTRLGLKEATIKENLGPFDAPRAVSLMAIAKSEIPWVFPEKVEREANSFSPPTLGAREDLRALPLVTIDGADARDFDDAVYAQSDDDPKNKGGWKLLVAIADVSAYVKPASALDHEAYKRGNSCYFPDRVVPMLPEALSNELCSLKPKVDRACLAVFMTIDKDGTLKNFRFTRGLMRSAARLTYEEVQAAQDGAANDAAMLKDSVIHPLYGAYETLLLARKKRGTLDLDVQETKITLENGKVSHIGPRARLDAHKLIEEFMVLANVAAASALQENGMAGLYRVHDVPSAEKLESLRGFLKGFDIKLPHGQQLRSIDLARVLEKFIGNDHAPVINEVMLRSQSQAIYSAENIGHFGLALARYAHFTSPIRRYADLIVHRALIRLYRLGEDGLRDEEIAKLDEIGEHISFTERRAIEAERESNDRYTALYLARMVGQEFDGRVSGVTRAGLFIRLAETGADGLLPMSSLPADYYHHDEARHMLAGQRTGQTFRLADKLRIKLVEADPILGSCRFALAGVEESQTGERSINRHHQLRQHRKQNKNGGGFSHKKHFKGKNRKKRGN